MRGYPGTKYTTARPIVIQFLGIYACMTYIINVARVIAVLILFDILSMSVGTTRHRKMYGRLVQELNVCTVGSIDYNVHGKRKHILGDSLAAYVVSVGSSC